MAQLRARRQFPDVFKEVLTYQGTFDITDAATGSGTSGNVDITVKGAALGDFVLVTTKSAATTAGTALVGHVTSADTIKITLLNNSAGAVNMAGTVVYNVVVLKPNEQVFFA
jgi:hypothetical protein